jgi:hypothetical protein
VGEQRIIYAVTAEPPEEVRVELQRVWRDNLVLGVPSEQKFRHLYVEAPAAASVVFVLRAREGEVGPGRIVGAKGLAERRYWLAGREVRAAISGDFAVDPAHRHLLPALQLARRAREHVHSEYAFGYGFPNHKAVGVMQRAGYRPLGKVERHVRVLRHAAYLARLAAKGGAAGRLLSLPGLGTVVGSAIDAVRRLLELPRVARAAATHRLEWLTCPDARFDALWAEARGAYTLVGVRDAAFLAWRHPRSRFATLVRRADGLLRAYAVVEQEKDGAAHLRDLFGHPEDLPPLVDHLLPALRRQGASSISVRFLGAQALRRALEERGFAVRGEGRAVILEPGAMAAESPLLEDPASWHLFDGDEDA